MSDTDKRWEEAVQPVCGACGCSSGNVVRMGEGSEAYHLSHSDCYTAMLTELRSLRSDLLKYGKHVGWCSYFIGHNCNCGWDELRAAIEAA